MSDIMTRSGRRLIEDFLLPALDKQKYGDRLCWVDKKAGYFSIRWSHKNAAKWTLEDTVVFQDWDRLKGHFHPEIKGYYMQAKQRFRAALYKLSTVRKVCSKEKHTKIYQLVQVEDKKKADLQASHPKYRKDNGFIRTSVICRNLNVPLQESAGERTEEQKPVVEKEMSEHFAYSSSSDSLSSDASDTPSIAAEQTDLHHAQNLLNFHERSMRACMVDHTIARPQPHVPVQRLPEYIPSKSRLVPYKVIKREKDCPIRKEEEMDVCSQALNLSIKSDTYESSAIPISAR